jgi:arginine deiminase
MLSSSWLSRFSSLQVRSTRQVSVFDAPTDIITHCPSLTECFPFHLDAFLFQSPPNPQRAADAHQQFCKQLSAMTQARVWTVREVLSNMPSSRLRELVFEHSHCRFRVVPGALPQKELMQKDYFDESLSRLSKQYLIDLLLLHPSITITVDHSSTGFSLTEIPVTPMANLVFTRDQQIVTAEGLVIGRFAMEQRRPENELMAVVWEELGARITHRVNFPARLEGGDFFPFGRNLALLGVGLRTNMDAAQELLHHDAIGTDRLVIVEDIADRNQERSHLDTFFSPVDHKVCLCLDKVAQDEGRFTRIAHEWRKTESGWVEDVRRPFGEWLKREGYTVVMATIQEQRNYFMSNLTLGRSTKGRPKLFLTNPKVENLLRRHGLDCDIGYVDFSPICSMYGGVHSASQLFRRPS